MEVRDRREPFCYQEVSATKAIRAALPAGSTRPGRTQAVAVYQALTEIANEQYRTGGRDHFEASREQIGEYSGTSTKTVDRVAALLKRLDLVTFERRDGKPNLWALLTRAAEGGDPGTHPSPGPDTSDPGTHPGDPGTPPPIQGKEGKKTKKDDVPLHTAPLSHLLAELVAANGSPRPRVSQEWATEEDRMQRLDGRDPALAEALIRWCQADPFWRANVMSMPKLREKFDQLRLHAAREEGSGAGGTADRVRDLLRQAEAAEEAER